MLRYLIPGYSAAKFWHFSSVSEKPPEGSLGIFVVLWHQSAFLLHCKEAIFQLVGCCMREKMSFPTDLGSRFRILEWKCSSGILTSVLYLQKPVTEMTMIKGFLKYNLSSVQSGSLYDDRKDCHCS